jgi:hypothetical protein
MPARLLVDLVFLNVLPLIYFLSHPGSAIFRCRSASVSAGITFAIVVCSLFCQPVMTSPCIIASKSALATSAGSSFSSCPTLVMAG